MISLATLLTAINSLEVAEDDDLAGDLLTGEQAIAQFLGKNETASPVDAAARAATAGFQNRQILVHEEKLDP